MRQLALNRRPSLLVLGIASIACVTALLTAILVWDRALAADPSPEFATDGTEVILLAEVRRGIEVIDAATLEPIGSYSLPDLEMGVTPAPDGRTLYVHQMVGNACCSLYAFDIASGHVEHLMDISMHSAITGDGRWLATTRGMPGVEVFDTTTNEHVTLIPGHGGVYGLIGHPYGRWAAGLNVFRGEKLAFFDLEQQTLESVIKRPPGTGAWLGDHFYLYGVTGDRHQLWSLEPGTTELGASIELDLSTASPRDGIAQPRMSAAGEQWLTLHYGISWGSRLGGRAQLGPDVPGGVFVIDPHSSNVRHLIPEIDIASLATTADGQRLVALDRGESREATPRLLLIDTETGAVLIERDLRPAEQGEEGLQGYWSAVETVTLPADLVDDLRQ